MKKRGVLKLKSYIGRYSNTSHSKDSRGKVERG